MDSKGPDRTFNPPCPIIYDCLGYQACLFEFNSDFCPYLTSLLGQVVLLNIVCFRDETEVVPLKFKKKKDLVLHIYQKYPPLQEKNNLGHLELPEDEVFGRQCSPPRIAKESEGFFGSCSQDPPSAQVTSQQLWPLLGKTLSASCRNNLFQVYCAFQYDNEGFCLPPMYHNKNNKSAGIFSLPALPAARYQPHCNVRRENLTKQIVFLKPVRLAFMIMVHDGYQQAMDLLSAIYREEFLYVIHVNKQNPDLRRELNQLISQSNFPSHNIYILPEERSFVTPLSSYENVRAQLEGFSELLCFDSWDFVISLSEDDIPLRNVDDLAAALSPYRGFSFLSLPPNSAKDDDKESALNDIAFSACDGFVYKVSYKKPTSKLNIFRTSNKGAFSRKFTAYLVNETMRSQVLNDHQFYLQTDILPDESYISTVLMNSPHRESVYFASIFSTIGIEAGNYLSEFYICKNHSQLECSGIEELISRSHSSFFLRFLSQPPPDIRAFTLSLAKDNYYTLLEKYFPPILQRLIVEDAIERFSASAKLPPDHLQVESIMKFHIAPSLVPQDPCCASDSLSSYSEITDFTYWIVANLFNRTSGKYIESRLMLQPSLQNRFCFSDGDLRMAFISPWIGHLEPSDRQFSRFTPEIIMPLPFGPAFTNDVLINLFFSTEVVSSKCRSDHKGNPILSPMDTKNFTDFIIVNLRLISPNYEEKCATNILLNWKNEETKTTSSQQKRRAIVKSFVMHCKNMEPGQWTLQIREIEPVKSDVYRFPLYLLDLQHSGDLASQLNEVVHLWDLKRFLLLNNENSFEFFEPETQDENLDSPKKKIKLPDFHNSENVKRRTAN
ncbi:Xylosyltransferase 1, partial [Araneus ventricosus]